MKKIIITGALGQDGVILSNILKKNKYNVFGFINKNKKNKLKKIKYFSIYERNKSDIKKKLDLIKPNVIVHFGADNPSFGKKFFFKDYRFNLNFTKNLIDYVSYKKNIKLILISTSQIYKSSQKKVNENSPTKNKSYYSKFRLESTQYLLNKKNKFKLNASILILFNHDAKYRNSRFLFPRLMQAIKSNNLKFIKKIYEENISEDFSHANDICNAIYLLIKKNKNPDKLILSSGKVTKINNIINLYYKKRGNLFRYLKTKKDKKPLIGNNLKARNLLDWSLKKNSVDVAREIYKNLKI